MKTVAGVALLAFALSARPVEAQSDAARLIAAARQQIEELNTDSAFTLLQRALGSQSDPGERVAAFKLLGITQLSRGDRVSARQSFEQTLRLDAGARVDDVADLHSDARVVFGEARAALGLSDAPAGAAAGPLAVALDVPGDTVVPSLGGALRITSRPTRHAVIIETVWPADAPGQIVWADTQDVAGIGTRTWNLRARDGSPVAPGRYALRATARDSAGQVSQAFERILEVSRVPVDTQPHPRTLTGTDFRPESLRLKRGSPAGLAIGLLLGASAALLPTALGSTELNAGLTGDGTAYAVAGTVSLAAVVGFLAGHRTRVSPESIHYNQELRQRDAVFRRDVVEQNRRAMGAAPIRVRAEGAGP